MTATPAAFRLTFPEFGDTGAYPDAFVSAQFAVAALQLDAVRWGDLLDYGTYLVTAHRLALRARASADAANGKPPGAASGPVSNKSVDKVSIGYDTSSASEEGAGLWNMTIYGQEFIRLARQIGSGPVQIGVPDGDYAGSMFNTNGYYAGPWL